ncbi:Aste57867_265 [Aphanomyces stellatus]|uniref:Aste57867_265 protein n=1 Tax=Aphanomyces stellatus TaxID=120398 RepID=A0A485K382_9STRA|nr:hypothetical protein As57867_000265 [Aphanomyces stellatus]VFT77491.1 Aste57867_265 [Aphanomyces stellatus]
MATPTATCFFNDCDNMSILGSWKCDFHKNRSRCLVDACQNQVYARHLCVRHGGKRRCEAEDCDRNVRIGNLCTFHGTGPHKKLCIEDGCKNVAHKRHKCVRHGGGRQCKVDGCKTHARSGGFCCRHSRLTNKSPPPSIDVKAESPLRSQIEASMTDLMTEWKLLPMIMDVTVLTDATPKDDDFKLVRKDINQHNSISLDDVFADFVEDVLDKPFLDELFPSEEVDHTVPPHFF